MSTKTFWILAAWFAGIILGLVAGLFIDATSPRTPLRPPVAEAELDLQLDYNLQEEFSLDCTTLTDLDFTPDFVGSGAMLEVSAECHLAGEEPWNTAVVSRTYRGKEALEKAAGAMVEALVQAHQKGGK